MNTWRGVDSGAVVSRQLGVELRNSKGTELPLGMPDRNKQLLPPTTTSSGVARVATARPATLTGPRPMIWAKGVFTPPVAAEPHPQPQGRGRVAGRLPLRGTNRRPAPSQSPNSSVTADHGTILPRTGFCWSE